MDSIRRKLFLTVVTFFVMILLSVSYILYNWPYTPKDAINDGLNAGPYAIILDVIIIFVFYRVWKNKETEA